MKALSPAGSSSISAANIFSYVRNDDPSVRLNRLNTPGIFDQEEGYQLIIL
ncbi:MAG: hypothetical protein JW860_10220 [Sedimentisphaerales bacterium]|nr:hypothetical protein [Sedimentisphaerales bacterium]